MNSIRLAYIAEWIEQWMSISKVHRCFIHLSFIQISHQNEVVSWCICYFVFRCHRYLPCVICHNPSNNESVYTRVWHFNIIVLYSRVCHLEKHITIENADTAMHQQNHSASDGIFLSDAAAINLIINQWDVEFITCNASIHPITNIYHNWDATGSWNL